jgi:hypothetical protein
MHRLTSDPMHQLTFQCSRYFRGHGLRAQVLLLLSGMIGSIFICSLHQNDNGAQNLSGLNDYLVQLLPPLYRVHNQWMYPAVYGDTIFTPLATLTWPYLNANKEQCIVNARFSSLHEDIEHKFAQIFGLYQVLQASWRHQLFFNGESCYCCFNEGQNERFKIRAPTIAQYLPLNKVMAPPTPMVFDVAGLNLF